MKKMLFVLTLAVLTAIPAAAHEEIPEVEIFAGFSMQKIGVSNNDVRTFQDKVFGWNGTWNNNDTSFFLKSGMAGSVAYNLNEYFSIVTEGKYYKGDVIKGSYDFEFELPAMPGIPVQVQAPFVIGLKNVSVLAGPRFTYRNLLNERATVFVHALAGLDYWRLHCDYSVSGIEHNATGDKFGPGVSIGGGLDINVHEKIAVRVIQADYYMTRQIEQRMNNFNFSFGIVFRIGEKVLK